MNTVRETSRNTRPDVEWVHYEYRGIHIKSFFRNDTNQTWWSIVELGYKVRINVPSLDDAISKIDAHFAK